MIDVPDMEIIRPNFFARMAGNTAAVMRIWLRTIASNWLCHSGASTCVTSTGGGPPELLISISGSPNIARMLPTDLSTLCQSPISDAMAAALPPFASDPRYRLIQSLSTACNENRRSASLRPGILLWRGQGPCWRPTPSPFYREARDPRKPSICPRSRHKDVTAPSATTLPGRQIEKSIRQLSLPG